MHLTTYVCQRLFSGTIFSYSMCIRTRKKHWTLWLYSWTTKMLQNVVKFIFQIFVGVTLLVVSAMFSWAHGGAMKQQGWALVEYCWLSCSPATFGTSSSLFSLPSVFFFLCACWAPHDVGEASGRAGREGVRSSFYRAVRPNASWATSNMKLGNIEIVSPVVHGFPSCFVSTFSHSFVKSFQCKFVFIYGPFRVSLISVHVSDKLGHIWEKPVHVSDKPFFSSPTQGDE